MAYPISMCLARLAQAGQSCRLKECADNYTLQHLCATAADTTHTVDLSECALAPVCGRPPWPQLAPCGRPAHRPPSGCVSPQAPHCSAAVPPSALQDRNQHNEMVTHCLQVVSKTRALRCVGRCTPAPATHGPQQACRVPSTHSAYTHKLACRICMSSKQRPIHDGQHTSQAQPSRNTANATHSAAWVTHIPESVYAMPSAPARDAVCLPSAPKTAFASATTCTTNTNTDCTVSHTSHTLLPQPLCSTVQPPHQNFGQHKRIEQLHDAMRPQQSSNPRQNLHLTAL